MSEMFYQSGNHFKEGREWENLLLDFCVGSELVVIRCNSDITNIYDLKNYWRRKIMEWWNLLYITIELYVTKPHFIVNQDYWS